ncbi:MAG TPA: hypothetical protein VMT88_14165 [Actinomycetes bacterium]|nr:hypothetical protein [Actinomycetes bacterium]
MQRVGQVILLTLATTLGLTGVTASAAAPSVPWIDQFGSRASESGTWGLDVFRNEVFTGGRTFGTLPGQTSAGDADAWIQITDERGIAVWTVQFGTPKWDNVEDVDAAASGLYVIGATSGALAGANAGGTDGYLTKYDRYGHELWATQFGTRKDDWAISVSADQSGIYVYGQTYGAFPGCKNRGGADLMVARFQLDGTLQWVKQFGSRGHEEPWALEPAKSGIYIDGYTDGRLRGATSKGGWDAYVGLVSRAGRLVWVRQFGSRKADFGEGLAVDPRGVYVSGQTFGNLNASGNRGGSDAFVRKFSPAGSPLWSRQFGTSQNDDAGAVALVHHEAVVIGVTAGVFPGQTNLGGADVFVRAFDTSNAQAEWTRQFGTPARETVGWAWGGADRIFVIGDTTGAFPNQENAGSVDTYLARIDLHAGR